MVFSSGVMTLAVFLFLDLQVVGTYIFWLVLSDEQMSKGWPFFLLNDEQMSNWLGVEHQPVLKVWSKLLLVKLL